MNAIDKRKIAEGLLYNFHMQRSATTEHVDALVAIKDIARKSGLVLTANKYGQIEILDAETRAERARTFSI